jgi:UDP-N-acetylmuramoylalanine--D-glutamate ligase
LKVAALARQGEDSMELEGQNVLVLGLGLSGRSAARFCVERGARVVAADERPEDAIDELAELDDRVDLRLGESFPDMSSYDLVVPSPGIPASRWQSSARKAWGDIELCFRALQIPIIAVTGTNGKSTVVRLIEAMAQAAGLRARAAGNLGIPALDLVGAPLDLAILEVSSFQLESVDAFRPRVAVLLNLSPDHFDRHHDLEGYLAAKVRIFARQGDGDCAILNGNDNGVRDIALPQDVERLRFHRQLIAGRSVGDAVVDGAWMDGRNAIVRRNGAQSVVNLEGVPLSSADQNENILAALLALSALDVDLDAAAQALASFKGLPHRREEIAEFRGVRYIDDSKATNIGAAIHALGSTTEPILWIVGGRHKGGDLSALVEAAVKRVRHAFAIGEAAGEFATALEGVIPCERVGDLAKAVEAASSIAQRGDVVLLAPACSSFDQFDSFADRGLAFQTAVRALAQNAEES